MNSKDVVVSTTPNPLSRYSRFNGTILFENEQTFMLCLWEIDTLSFGQIVSSIASKTIALRVSEVSVNIAFDNILHLLPKLVNVKTKSASIWQSSNSFIVVKKLLHEVYSPAWQTSDCTPNVLFVCV